MIEIHPLSFWLGFLAGLLFILAVAPILTVIFCGDDEGGGT